MVMTMFKEKTTYLDLVVVSQSEAETLRGKKYVEDKCGVFTIKTECLPEGTLRRHSVETDYVIVVVDLATVAQLERLIYIRGEQWMYQHIIPSKEAFLNARLEHLANYFSESSIIKAFAKRK